MRPPGPIRRCVGLASLVLLAACDPQDHRPGLWLSGELVETPVTDWSFAADFPEIFLETRTWYGFPHSVTTWQVAHGGTLYVPSLYYEKGEEFPDSRFWNRNVMRDPRVRLEIGERIFERKAVLVEDPAEHEAVVQAFARKSDFWRDLLQKPRSEWPGVYFFRMDPRE